MTDAPVISDNGHLWSFPDFARRYLLQKSEENRLLSFLGRSPHSMVFSAPPNTASQLECTPKAVKSQMEINIMPNIFRLLPWRLSQFLWAQQAQDRPVENRLVFEGHERERSLSEYEMYYWGFSPAPWY